MARRKVEIGIEVTGGVVRQYKKVANSIRRNNKSIRDSLRGVAEDSAKAFNKMKGAAGEFKKGLIDFAKRFGPAAIAVTVLTTAFIKLRQGMEFVNRVSIEFESKLSKIKAIVQPTEKGFKELSDRAQELGESTIFTASQVAEAFTEMAKLGLKTKEITESSKSILSLAAIAQTDMAMASETVVKTMNQFNLEAEESQRVVDVMASSFTNSALDMNKFSESMKFVGTTARLVGLDIEETTALLSVMADNGIEASMAGTSLNQAMIQLTDKSSKANKLFKKMGVETASFREKMIALRDSNIDVGDAFGLLDVRAARALNILIENINGTEKSVDELTEKYKESIGVADKMAETMLDNVGGAAKLLTSAQEGLGIAIGEAFGADKRKRIEFYTMIVKLATNAVKAHRDDLKALSSFFTTVIISSIKVAARAFSALSAVIDTVKAGFFTFIELTLKGFRSLFDAASIVKKAFGGVAIETHFLDASIEEFGSSAEKAAGNAIEAFNVMIGAAEKSSDRQIAAEERLERARRNAAKNRIEDAKRIASASIGGLGGAAKTPKGRVIDLADILEKRRSKNLAIRRKEIDEALALQEELRLKTLGGQKLELERLKIFEKEKKGILQKGNQDTLLLEQFVNQKRKEINDRYEDERKQKRLDTLNSITATSQNFFTAMSSLSEIRARNEIKAAEAAGKSEEQIQRIRKKSFETQKRFQLLQAVGNTALGFTRQLSAATYPFNLFLAGLTAAAGATQIAAINAQKFQHGGFVTNGTTTGDQTLARVNRGELILNAAQQRNILALSNGRGDGSTPNITFGDINITANGGNPTLIAEAVNETLQERTRQLSDMLKEKDSLQVT